MVWFDFLCYVACTRSNTICYSRYMPIYYAHILTYQMKSSLGLTPPSTHTEALPLGGLQCRRKLWASAMVGSTYQPTELHYGAKTIFKPLQTLQEYVLANLSYHLILLQYTDSLFVCLFVCSLYKFAPLQGMPQNALCPLMRSRAIFLWDRGWLTTYAVDENRPPVFFYSGVRDTIFIPRVAWLPQRSSLILVVSEHSRPLRKTQNVFYGNDLWQSALWQKTVRYFLGGGPTYIYNVHLTNTHAS